MEGGSPTQDELEAALLAEDFEGWSATPYLDTAAVPHVWTIGFGSTRWFDGSAVTGHTRAITKDEGTRLAALELHEAATLVAADVHVVLSPHEKAALEDFIYNVGRGAFAASTLLRKLNAGDMDGAAAEFLRWNRAGGVVLAGLVRRRAAERALFLASRNGASPAAVAGQHASSSDTDRLMDAELDQIRIGKG